MRGRWQVTGIPGHPWGRTLGSAAPRVHLPGLRPIQTNATCAYVVPLKGQVCMCQCDCILYMHKCVSVAVYCVCARVGLCGGKAEESHCDNENTASAPREPATPGMFRGRVPWSPLPLPSAAGPGAGPCSPVLALGSPRFPVSAGGESRLGLIRNLTKKFRGNKRK